MKDLLEVFRIPKKKVYIAGNIGAIARQMQKAIAKDEFIVIVGTIDDDKDKKSAHFKKFVTEKETKNFIFKKLEENRQYLIILKPAIEKFILFAAKQGNVNSNDFKLPDNFKEFKDLTKSESVLKNQNFRNFLKQIYHSRSCFKELNEILKSIHQKYSLPDF